MAGLEAVRSPPPQLRSQAGSTQTIAAMMAAAIFAKEREAPRIQAWREEFLKTVATISPTRLVFLDETGTHTPMTRDHARAPCGSRVVGIVPRQRGTVLTVVGAIALDGVRAMMAYEGGTSAEALLRFVNEVLAPSLRPRDSRTHACSGEHARLVRGGLG